MTKLNLKKQKNENNNLIFNHPSSLMDIQSSTTIRLITNSHYIFLFK